MTVIEVDEDPGGVLAAVDGLATAVEENAKDERLLVRRLRELRDGPGRGPDAGSTSSGPTNDPACSA